MSIIRIDADEIRSICPGYHGDNADLFQQAVSWGVCRLYYRANKCKLNVLLDGTLANYEHALDNVNIALKKNRDVFLCLSGSNCRLVFC
jgi:hypothetical protein